jgi:hypothetical protein
MTIELRSDLALRFCSRRLGLELAALQRRYRAAMKRPSSKS